MKPEEVIARLKEMHVSAQELAKLRDPALEGDIQIILAILTDKLRHLSPEDYLQHQVEFE